MNKEDNFLRNLMQELPREKAPEGITQLIMQKIKPKTQVVVDIPKLKFWETQAFYILLAICATEGWLLWSKRQWFSLDNLEILLKNIYVQAVEYFAVNSFSPLLTVLFVIGIAIYLFVKERIESTRCCLSV